MVNYIAQTSNIGGWLHELPYYMAKGEGVSLSLDFVFILNLQIVSILFLALYLRDKKWRVNRMFMGAVILNLAYSIPCFLVRSLFHARYARIPTVILFSTLLTGCEEGP